MVALCCRPWRLCQHVSKSLARIDIRASSALIQRDGSLQVGESDSDRDESLYINNKDGLRDKLEDFRLPVGLPWLETQVLDATKSQTIDDIHDDLERELAFYNQVGERRYCEVDRSVSENVCNPVVFCTRVDRASVA